MPVGMAMCDPTATHREVFLDLHQSLFHKILLPHSKENLHSRPTIESDSRCTIGISGKEQGKRSNHLLTLLHFELRSGHVSSKTDQELRKKQSRNMRLNSSTAYAVADAT
jgi:hypothetical protein